MEKEVYIMVAIYVSIFCLLVSVATVTIAVVKLKSKKNVVGKSDSA